MKKLIIEFPDNMAADIIAKAAKFRKGRQGHAIRQQQLKSQPIDTKLGDEEFLIESIKQSVIADFMQMSKAEAAATAANKIESELAQKLGGK